MSAGGVAMSSIGDSDLGVSGCVCALVSALASLTSDWSSVWAGILGCASRAVSASSLYGVSLSSSAVCMTSSVSRDCTSEAR